MLVAGLGLERRLALRGIPAALERVLFQLRADEACATDVADAGHRLLRADDPSVAARCLNPASQSASDARAAPRRPPVTRSWLLGVA